MAFDAMPGGDPRGPWCKSCKRPIEAGQASQRLGFAFDPHDVNGLYHEECSGPILSLMRVMNLLYERRIS